MALLDHVCGSSKEKLAARFDEESLHMDALSLSPACAASRRPLLYKRETPMDPGGFRHPAHEPLGDYGILDDTARHKPPSGCDMSKIWSFQQVW